MSVGRCTRCNGQKKATYLGGIYVNCYDCQGVGYIPLPTVKEPIVNKPINIADDFISQPELLGEILHTEIKPVLTFESSKALLNSTPDVKKQQTRALDIQDLISKSQAKRLEIQSGNKLDKRSKAYRDQKLKEALENG